MKNLLLIAICLFIFVCRRNCCSLLIVDTKRYRKYMLEELSFKYVKCPSILARVFKQKGKQPLCVPIFVFVYMLFVVIHIFNAIYLPILSITYNLDGKGMEQLFLVEAVYTILTDIYMFIPEFVFKRKAKHKI